MSNRIKLPQTILTRLRAEEILGEIATLKLEERDQKNAMDRALTSVREQFEAPLDSLAKQIGDKTALLETWASANPDEFPRNRKSIEMLHGVIGYRTGTPKLVKLAKWTWDRVLEKLQELDLLAFIRVKSEVNREALIAAVGEGRLLSAEARQLGVQVVQDESFFVEPKLESLETRTALETAA